MGIKPLLDAANKRRADAIKKMDKLTSAVADEGRTALTVDEAAKFERHATDIREADEAITSFTAQLDREARAAIAGTEATSMTVESNGSPAIVVREELTYGQHSRNSYMRDLAALMVPQSGLDAQGAMVRMSQHHKEAEIEARRDSTLAARLGEMRRTPQSLRNEQRVNPNTTAGTGGEFVPPLWLVAQYVPFVRPGRVFADRVQNLALPAGIDVINLPKITVGSLTGIQANQGGAVQSQDIVTSTVSAKVNTIAGQEDISLQLLEQSPISMDGVIYDDLSRDYDQRLDLQVLAGSGVSGQHLGVLAVPGQASAGTANASLLNANNITSTATLLVDPTAANSSQYKNVINGVNQIETLRFANPTGIWVHPRRANAWSAAADSTGRPVYIPAKYGQFNTIGTNESAPAFQGVAGELYGLPVVKDANMVTLGNGFTGTAYNTTGGTQDAVVVLNEQDLYLWEGTMRMRALPEILSGTLQIRYQLYAYSAFMPNRFPVSISIISGAGYAAPTF